MKILLISDIHGNFPALEAVGRAAAGAACTHILNCGDSLVYAPFPNETIDWLRAHRVLSIRGNTDDRVIKLLMGKSLKKPAKPEKRIMYTSSADLLTPENAAYLVALPRKRIVRCGQISLGLFHGSPTDHEEFLTPSTPEERFEQLTRETTCTIVVTGHSHTPFYRIVRGVHFINPGSVGRMFDGCPEASFALLSMTGNHIDVRHYRVAYDIESVVTALRKHRLPAIYAEMFRTGTKQN
ncbi:MAG: metallophosphoesterase family protein [Desulfobulbus sp.]|nr:metallophosphoesterase family protein [Desulfobulbus sp.]